jgi:hypothetical protein
MLQNLEELEEEAKPRKTLLFAQQGSERLPDVDPLRQKKTLIRPGIKEL